MKKRGLFSYQFLGTESMLKVGREGVHKSKKIASGTKK
jgi:hypothetical protein